MYVITGGAGFIGSNIAWGLEALGLGPVAIVDRLREAEKWRNVSEREIAHVVDPENLMAFLASHGQDITAIIHMGAISSTTERNVDLIIENNFRLSVALWDWCTANTVRFIYASSAATYGDGTQGFEDESTGMALARLKPLNPYGWSKHLFDRRVSRIIADGGVTPPQWAGLKFFNVYGPNEYHKGRMQSVVAQVYTSAAANEAAILFRSHHPDYVDGGQLRDFIWVGDCIDIVNWLLDTPSVSGLFNCGTGKARSFADLAAAVYRALGKEPNIEFVDTPEDIRDKYQYFTEATMDRLRGAGYEKPMTELEDGVRSYVVDFLHTDDPYR